MFAQLGRVVVYHPWRVIALWVVAAVALIAFSPGLPTAGEETDFLPGRYEAVKAEKLRERAFPDAFTPSVIIVVRRTDGGSLTAADSTKVPEIAGALKGRNIANVEQVIAGEPSPNKAVQTLGVQMPTLTEANRQELFDSLRTLRADLKQVVAGTGLTANTTGAVAQEMDQEEASAGLDAIILLATIALIIILLLVIFRSPVIALLPIVVIGIVSQAADGLIAIMVRALGLQADSSASQLLIVVLFGVGTDYILFLMFRYRERLRAGDDPQEAMVGAVARVGEAITSAAGVVIIAFLAMMLSSISIFRSWGPALAIAVTVNLLAGLTVIPAITSLLGTGVFWPSKTWRHEPRVARFAALGTRMARRPAAFAALSGVVMAALAVGTLGFRSNFDFSEAGLPKTAESRVALNDLRKGLPPGLIDPTHVYLSGEPGRRLGQGELTAFSGRLAAVGGVGQVAPPQLSKDGTTADFTLTLTTPPGSAQALDTVRGPLRRTAHDAAPGGTTVLVGGITAVYVDLQAAMHRDYALVFPVAALLIMVILGLLLRSLVAPWYLIASVGLGYGATLGAATLIFQNLRGEPGLIFQLPLVMYMFVVALGTDYNILMMARLREEAREGLSPRAALAAAIRHTGPTIAAAGLILAGSFAALLVAGNPLLSQLGFAISFGIAVAAFVMSVFFTPSLTALIGHRAWWPGHADEPLSVREQEQRPQPPGPARTDARQRAL
ncbi:MMPL family transporter [Actinomadura sp. HBU206391]|uniref:MMPL family transporter n=1 Tax=Actinomadura sp. HBU206391 TaxID=2731692 RepID=UPI00164F9075|nr:MMPL family transporter [Actinomadura sp. HBU206391]MBC6462906.1 MMPL family transporter [Actinomadura sp. HBU206391]